MFQQFVLTMPDPPTSMSDQTVCEIADRIAEHAARHGLDRVQVVLHGEPGLHGGEPLLAGPSGLRWIFRTLRSALAGVAELELGVQTDGRLLDERFAELFLAAEVQVAIVLAAGHPTEDMVRAVKLLGSPDYRPVFAGLLSTIDVDTDPIEVFEELAALRPPRIDLLLPAADWEEPPPRPRPGGMSYGDWLVTLFEHWYAAPPRIGVRLFEEAMHALLGGASRSEAVGLSAPHSIVIETDGSVRPAGPRGLAGLSATCRSCPIVSACGGGLRAHRYRADNGFDNPSIYCTDLTRLITHMQGRMTRDLTARPDLVNLHR